MILIRLLITIVVAIVATLNPVYSQYDFNVNSIPDSLLKKANSVVRHSITHLDIYDEKLVYTYDYAITALNKKHEHLLLFGESYSKNESKVKDVKIAIYDAEGELIKKVKKKEIKEYGLQDIEFADDTRTMAYIHSSPNFPVTIHVTYKHEVESPFYLKNWFPTTEFRQAVESASIQIRDHHGGSYAFRPYKLPSPVQEDELSLSISCKNQKGYAKEGFMPGVVDCFPRLEFSLKRLKYFDHIGTIDNWEGFGPWVYKEMFLPKQDIEYGLLKAETNDIVREEDSDLVKAQKLYRYIQENTRYVLITLEDGGWSPLSVATVHNKKYGDCKALSFYYNSLCKAHRIDASLVLVYAGEEKYNAKEGFCSPSQFNHVISVLDINNKRYWVDCTSKKNPFNFLGEFTDDRTVLVFSEATGQLTRTPEYKYIRKTQTQLTLAEDGSISADINFETGGIGIAEKLYRLPEMTKQEMTSYQYEILSSYQDPKITAYTYEFDTARLDFRENIKIECKHAGERLGDHLKIKLNRKDIEVPKLKRDKNRDWPIQLLRNKEFESTTVLNYGLSIVPIIEDDVKIETEFGAYTYTSTASSGKVTIHRKLKINKATYQPERYNELKSFFDKVRKVEKRSIILSAKS